VRANQAVYPITLMCRLLGVSPSGFYAWRQRAPSARGQANEQLLAHIRLIHERSRGTYGAPRIQAELVAEGLRVSRKRVARLMRLAGLQGVSRRGGVSITVRGQPTRPAPDLVQRRFQAEQPNRLWVADITYIPTWAGFLYLAVVIDVFSRRVVGWAMATHLRATLVLQALEMALAQRRPTDVIHHSDQGTQYTCVAFSQRCHAAGVRPTMGSVGDCFDTALAERFFATLECERLQRCRFRCPAAAQQAVFAFIEGWYNPHRRHSRLNYLSPIEYERRYATLAQSPKSQSVH